MSDLSHCFCRKCREPEYACECFDPDIIESVLTLRAKGKEIPKDHPFFDDLNLKND